MSSERDGSKQLDGDRHVSVACARRGRTTWLGLAGAALVLSGCSMATQVRATTTIPCTGAPPLSNWTTPQLAAQSVVLSVRVSQVADVAPVMQQGFGGIILLGSQGPPSLRPTLDRLQALGRPGLKMAIMSDDEGGGVFRLANLLSPVPWARTMGTTMTPAQIRSRAFRLGQQMRALGLTMDLAPVLDVDGRDVSPGVSDPDGYRSFGPSPALVAADGVAFAQGLRAAGIVSVVKHFPGLGGSSGNTDYAAATTMAWSTLRVGGLVPFRAALAVGVVAIMVGNASVPGLTDLPASLSPAVLRDVLRQQLGFRGLVMTDSLGAGALSALKLSPAAAAVRALGAGADMVLGGSTSTATAAMTQGESMVNAIVAAVKTGTVARSTLEGAVAHVLAAKGVALCSLP